VQRKVRKDTRTRKKKKRQAAHPNPAAERGSLELESGEVAKILNSRGSAAARQRGSAQK
jgi:hypothetical protein